MTPLRYFALFAVIAVGLVVAAVARADTKPKPKFGIGTAVIKRLAPPWVCTMANRLEVFIDEDNIMWACECEALSTGHICRWQVIGGVDSVATRKFKRSHHRLVIRYALPGVVR